ncbi:hypothetical protein HDU67_008703 [Dinochytrium kinnereticum]|nr:hypothetical protein HDU67_008703 [Dinochytrium kinnereticum]
MLQDERNDAGECTNSPPTEKRLPEEFLDIEQREMIQTATDVIYNTSLLVLHATYEGETMTRTKYRMMRHIAGLPVEEKKERRIYQPKYVQIPEQVSYGRQRAPERGDRINTFPSIDAKRLNIKGGGTDFQRRDEAPWQSAAITPSTQRQNARLSALLGFISRMNGEGTREESTGDLSDIIQISDRFDHMNQGASFERNFGEIQKLLERARNVDNSVDINAILGTAEAEKEKRKKKASTTMTGGGNGGAAGGSGNGQQNISSNNTNASQKPANLFELSLLDGKSQAGRKPLRVIAAELDKRIEQLRSNQSEWESFQARIMEYQKSQTVHTDIIRQNRLSLMQYNPDNRQNILSNTKQDHQFHRTKVLEKKKEIDSETLKRKLEVEKGKLKEKEEMNKFHANHKKWFVLVAAFARVSYIERTLNESHLRKEYDLQQNAAARSIQRCWKNYKRKQYEKKKTLAFSKIAKVFHIYVHRRRQSLKNKSADKIRQFFKEVHDVAKLLKIVKKYRFSVVKAQMMSRNFLEIRRAQVTLLCKYWDKHENGWWAHRKHANTDKMASNASLDEKVAKPKAKKKGKKQQKDDDKDKNSEKTYIKISDSTKIRIVLEDLIIRRRAYRATLSEYKEHYAKWSADFKALENDVQAPKKPVFKAMPGKEEKKVASSAAPAASPAESKPSTPVARPKGPRPDKEAHEREITAIKDQIEAVQKKLSAVQQTINSTDHIKGSYDGKRKELRAKLDELAKQRSEVNDQRTKILDKMKAVQANIKKKNDEVKSSKDKLGVKNVEDIEKQIASLEQQLTDGNLKLTDEKRIVSDIANLKKARKVLDTLGSQSSTVEGDKKQVDAYRAELDTLGPKKDAINKEYDVVKAELKDVDDGKRKDLGGLTELINQRKALKAEVDAAYESMRTLRADFKKQNDEWYHFERAERERRQKEYQESRKKDETARLTRAAEDELENSKIPAFTEEITICNSLIAFLQQYSSKPQAAATSTASPTPAPARAVDSSIPDGLVALKKKEDRGGEDYLVMGKGKKNRRGGSAAAGDHTPSPKTVIKLDLVSVDLFNKLKVNIPVTVADADSTIATLEEKKAKFLEDQAEQTAKNKAKAEAKIAALKAKVEAGASADDVIKELEESAAVEAQA